MGGMGGDIEKVGSEKVSTLKVNFGDDLREYTEVLSTADCSWYWTMYDFLHHSMGTLKKNSTQGGEMSRGYGGVLWSRWMATSHRREASENLNRQVARTHLE